MKRILLTLALSTGFFSVAQISSVGEWLGNNDVKGNPYILASDEHMELTKQSIAAYNESDVEKELSFYSDEMVERTKEFSANWHSELKKVTNEPWAMIPKMSLDFLLVGNFMGKKTMNTLEKNWCFLIVAK